MKIVTTLCLFVALCVAVPSCTPEVVNFAPETTKGNFHQDLTPGDFPGFTDCLNNALVLESGNVLVNYNVVTTSNTTNATAHVLLNNLVFSTSDPSVKYRGNFDMKLNAHSAKGEVLNFDTNFKLQGNGTEKTLGVRLQFRLVYNANGTMTVSETKMTALPCGI